MFHEAVYSEIYFLHVGNYKLVGQVNVVGEITKFLGM